MPNDDWEKYNRRDRGRQALQSGSYDRIATATPKTKSKSTPKTPCPHCNSTRKTTRSTQTFKDGSTHVRLNCRKYGKFIKWGH